MATVHDSTIATATPNTNDNPLAPSTMSDNANKTQSRLLLLSGELRNAIYNFALLTEDPIKFNKENPTPPGLLAVNQQIRAEAAPIYYQLNTFDVSNPDFSPIALQVFRKQSKPWLPSTMIREQRSVRIELKIRSANWANVLEWAKVAHADYVLGLWCSQELCPASVESVTRVLFTAATLRDLEWETVAVVLQQMREVSELEKVEWARR
ncbi:hypothetical protein M409DRAFT_16269 [Zasmidium cellare ATCC 36951]|uniref:Uncharacterized protein n=1 Tax=Zasmidium cellare ATCC 36951 TaxID=1080233 RepID=A0A6A6D6E2_ZASCE|nr:uncharacterized protein M409DRAFT_16269 [Zasmidium cellare ATCC 36951]KAF2173998.1 hypothetical protein M409DRAFT_16269 [Zasmidium cellare ATCC 36951]